MHTISTLVSYLVPADLILTSPESGKISSTSSPYFLPKNWYIVTSLNPVPSVFCLQANMYVDTPMIKSAFQPSSYFPERSLETIQVRLHKEVVYKSGFKN